MVAYQKNSARGRLTPDANRYGRGFWTIPLHSVRGGEHNGRKLLPAFGVQGCRCRLTGNVCIKTFAEKTMVVCIQM